MPGLFRELYTQIQGYLSTFFLLIFIRITLYQSLRQDIDQILTFHPWTIGSHTNINLALKLWIMRVDPEITVVNACLLPSQPAAFHSPWNYSLGCQPLTGSSTSFCTTQGCPDPALDSPLSCSTFLLVWPNFSQSTNLNPGYESHCQLLYND